jgi:hypothetical protein
MQLDFEDGLPTALIEAKAMEASRTLEIKLRIRASLIFEANTDKNQLEVRYLIKEVLPDIRFSIFRWREFWFGAGIFNIALQHLVDALPATRIPLQPEFVINVDPQQADTLWFNDNKAYINVDRTLPHFKISYAYRVKHALTLQDGLHVFLALEKKE